MANNRRFISPLISLSVFIALGLGNAAFAAPSKVDNEALISGKEALRYTVTRVCEGAQNCQEAVLAEGWITSGTVEQTKAQMATWPKKADVIFNSDGGDLLAAMELGKLIRANQRNTRIGAPKKTASNIELAPGRCLSACVLSFMGGVQRVLDPADVIGFHGLVMANSALGSGAASGADRAKLAMNAIGRYIESMGGDRRMVDFMLFAKGEQFQRIPYDTARQLGIDNQLNQPLNAWRLQATDSGALIALVSEKQSKGQFTTTLALTKPSGAESANDQLNLIVFVKPIGKEVQVQELQTRLADALNAQLNTRQSIIRGKVLTPWKANADGVQLILSFPSSAIESLAQYLVFDLEVNYPETLTGIDRYTKFGTQGLRGALAAIKK
jgi:hypothetical protein